MARTTPRITATLAVLLAVAALSVSPGAAQVGEGELEGGGTAKATAKVAKYAPGVGTLELGVTNGVAVTQITNFLAQATAQTADFGLIGTSLAAETCRGNYYFHERDFPQPTSVDNREGDASDVRDERGDGGAPVGVGRMEVEAKEAVPEAKALVTGAKSGVDGVFEIGGGSAEAVTRVIPGSGREALATATTSISLGGGALRLDDLRWFAHHRSGGDPTASASFEIGSATFGGVPYPTDDLAAFEQTLNDLLAPSGVVVGFPEVERLTEPTDLIRATPMTIEFRDSELAATAFGPALEITREQRENAFDQLTSLACDFASFLLVGDVAVSVATGTGFLVIELGGVEATSGDFVVSNPFATGSAGPAATNPPTGATPTTGSISDPGSSAAPAPPSTPGAVGPGPVATAPVSSSGPLIDLCESVHPSRDPSCSTGTVAAVVLVGVLATLAVGGGDYLRQRRRRGAA